MILSQKSLIIAVLASLGGGAASFIARGRHTIQEFVKEMTGSAIGFSLILIGAWLYPAILSDPWVFGAICFVTARLTAPVLSVFLWRLERVDITASIGTINLTSNGKEDHGTDTKND